MQPSKPPEESNLAKFGKGLLYFLLIAALFLVVVFGLLFTACGVNCFA